MIIKQHIPSIFTIINLFLGFLSIINVMSKNYTAASYFIVIAGLFDSIDGKIARIMGIPTNFGKEIDSLADMVSFCLAPSILLYSLYTYNLPGISGEIIASVPLIMGAIRLARFNILTENEMHSYFIGLPTPMNAISIASIVLFIQNIKVTNSEYSQPHLLLPLIISISYLMLSRIRYAKFPNLNFQSGAKNSIRFLGVLIFIMMFIISIFVGYTDLILAIFVSIYIISGILNYIFTLGNITIVNKGK